MINDLLILADKLDDNDFIKEADVVDEIIQKAVSESVLPLEEDDFPEELTRREFEPTKSLPELDDDALEEEPVMRGMDIVSKLKHIFTSLPDPDQWGEDVKLKVNGLLYRLNEVM